MACDFTKNAENGTEKGTVYVAENKMRGEFEISGPDGTFPMHMIHSGDWMYTWGGPMGESQGIRINTAQARANANRRGGPDMDEEMDFSCQPWSMDPSKFDVPSGVQFQDFGQTIPQLGAATGSIDMKALQCAACDDAPEESRAQCRQMLGCE